MGRLSNPRDAFLAMTRLLPVVLGRPIPTRRADPVVQHQRRLSDDDISELVHRRHDGETIDSLANAFGVHRTTVMAHVARHHRWPGAEQDSASFPNEPGQGGDARSAPQGRGH